MSLFQSISIKCLMLLSDPNHDRNTDADNVEASELLESGEIKMSEIVSGPAAALPDSPPRLGASSNRDVISSNQVADTLSKSSTPLRQDDGITFEEAMKICEQDMENMTCVFCSD